MYPRSTGVNETPLTEMSHESCPLAHARRAIIHASRSEKAFYSLVLRVSTCVASFTFHYQLMRIGLVLSSTAIFGKMNRYSV